MARVLGVNGIRNFSWSKHSFTDKMLDTLSDEYETVDVPIPMMLALTAWIPGTIERRGQIVANTARRGDHILAHSAGAAATIESMKLGAEYDTVFFFGAACAADIEIPVRGCKRLFNVYSPDDKVLMLGSLWPWHTFGPLGLGGYSGRDTRVTNIVAPAGTGHNDYVDFEQICYWRGFVRETLNASSDQ